MCAGWCGSTLGCGVAQLCQCRARVARGVLVPECCPPSSQAQGYCNMKTVLALVLIALIAGQALTRVETACTASMQYVCSDCLF